MARSWSSRAGVARAVCLARLCQALLQPELCLRGPGGSAATAAASAKDGKNGGGGGGGVVLKGTAAAAAALESLRGMLAEVTGTPVSKMAPVGKVRIRQKKERGWEFRGGSVRERLAERTLRSRRFCSFLRRGELL